MLYETHYKTKQGYQCALGCFQNYCHFHEIDFDEEDIFFFGDGFIFSYQEFDSEQGPFFTFSTRTFESLFDFCTANGLKIISADRLTQTEAQALLFKSISERKNISMNIHYPECSYSPLISGYVSSNTHAMQTHYVNPIGFDVEQEKIFLSDCCIPAFELHTFHDWTGFKPIAKAWSQTQYDFVIFDETFWEELKIVRKKMEKKQLLVEKIIKGLEEYLKPKIMTHNGPYGIDAANKTMEMIYSIDKFSEKSLILRCFMEEWVQECTTPHYYLCSAIEKILSSEKLVAEIKTQIQQWEIFAVQVLKYSLNKKSESTHRLANKMGILIKKETELFQNLLQELYKIC